MSWFFLAVKAEQEWAGLNIEDDQVEEGDEAQDIDTDVEEPPAVVQEEAQIAANAEQAQHFPLDTHMEVGAPDRQEEAEGKHMRGC